MEVCSIIFSVRIASLGLQSHLGRPDRRLFGKAPPLCLNPSARFFRVGRFAVIANKNATGRTLHVELTHFLAPRVWLRNAFVHETLFHIDSQAHHPSPHR